MGFHDEFTDIACRTAATDYSFERFRYVEIAEFSEGQIRISVQEWFKEYYGAANATIVVEQLSDVLKIPTWVVRVDQGSGQTYVHRRAGEDFERVDVALGVRYEGVVQVLELPLDEEELAGLRRSAAVLQEVARAIV